MLKFGIMLYLVPIVFVKFNVKFDIALEKAFYAKMSNFGIGTQIWHCIGDALMEADWAMAFDIARAFYNMLLYVASDKDHIWPMGSYNLKPEVLKLQPWSADFNPNLQRPTKLWVHFHDLP